MHRPPPALSNRRSGLLGATMASMLLVAVLLPFGSGCYRRVVGVKGDASSYDGKVYEPNLKEGEDNVVQSLFETRTVRPVQSP